MEILNEFKIIVGLIGELRDQNVPGAFSEVVDMSKWYTLIAREEEAQNGQIS